MKSQRLRWFLRQVSDRWVSVLISICALSLAIYTAYLERQHKRLSVQPHIYMSFYFNDQGAGWMTGNSGLGPAVIKWFTVYVDGKQQPTWAAVMKTLGIPAGAFEFSTLFPGELKATGGPAKIFWVPSGPRSKALIRDYSRVQLEVCYCSLYDECWKLTSVVGSRQRSDCWKTPPAEIK